MTDTNLIPDVHALDREIRAGYTLLAEYGTVDGEPRPVRTVLEQKPCFQNRFLVQLAAVTAGWAIAGSALRWDNGHFAVTWEIDGSLHGRRFRTYEEAKQFFDSRK